MLNDMHPDVARIFSNKKVAEQWLDSVPARSDWYRIHPWEFDDAEVSRSNLRTLAFGR